MLFPSPHRQPEPLLGLDLQADAVRLVSLGHTRQGQPRLEHCAAEPMAPGWVVEGRIEHFDAVTQTVSRLLRRTRVRTVRVAMALPEAAVITRRITLPRMRVSEELEARLRSEAEQLIPFPLQEVYLDYAMRGADAALTPSAPASAPRAPGADRMDVLLVAARRERVRDLQALAAAVGLQPVAVDVADFAARRAVWHLMARCAPARTRTSGVPTLAVLDLRADRVVWQCLQGDEVVHEGECMREPSGGDDAGEARPEPGVAEALAQALTGFPNDSWSGPGSGPFPGAADGRIEALWLTGAVEGCGGLAAALAGLLGCPCRVANPFEGMSRRRQPPWRRGRGAVSAWDEPQAGAATAYLPACGLALRSFQP